MSVCPGFWQNDHHTLRGAVFGALVTAAVQSSSAVMVVTIGLIDAGLLRFPQAVGIILGTNVGTCVTVQLLGLDFSRFSSLASCGAFFFFFWEKEMPVRLYRDSDASSWV